MDDNKTSRFFLKAYLTKWNFSVQAVASAAEALARLRAERCDLLLLDWAMPQTVGTELASAIKHEFGDAAPPMIMLRSSADSAREVCHGQDSPFAAFMVKPIRRQHLHRVLLSVFGGAREVVTSPRTHDSSLARRAPLRILVADDNLIDRMVALRLLERWRYWPDLASNGLEVLDAYAGVPTISFSSTCRCGKWTALRPPAAFAASGIRTSAHSDRFDRGSHAKGPRKMPGFRHGLLSKQAA